LSERKDEAENKQIYKEGKVMGEGIIIIIIIIIIYLFIYLLQLGLHPLPVVLT
jgi:hypothetical protein